MKNSQLPDFTIIRCDDKAALVDPESKVCLIVSKRIADTLNLKETNDKIYPIELWLSRQPVVLQPCDRTRASRRDMPVMRCFNVL